MLICCIDDVLLMILCCRRCFVDDCEEEAAEAEAEEEKEEAAEAGCSKKNKNPTWQCGEENGRLYFPAAPAGAARRWGEHAEAFGQQAGLALALPLAPLRRWENRVPGLTEALGQNVEVGLGKGHKPQLEKAW